LEGYQKPEFRIKDYGSDAEDYSFGCYDNLGQKLRTIKMRNVGDMWGTGLFKANACDFCDDLTTELADVSLGDAWIRPFCINGAGNNVLITRSLIAEELVTRGIQQGKLHVENISPDQILTSQRGNMNHKHKGLSVRLKHANNEEVPIQPKRFGNEPATLDFTVVQLIRMNVRRKSLEIWKHHPDAILFDRKMKIRLLLLKVVTRIYHYRSALSLYKRTLLVNLIITFVINICAFFNIQEYYIIEY
jgi:coenzyme F420 hydrogenase subunit beta